MSRYMTKIIYLDLTKRPTIWNGWSISEQDGQGGTQATIEDSFLGNPHEQATIPG